jgi:Protein of unknown function (DUF2934)
MALWAQGSVIDLWLGGIGFVEIQCNSTCEGKDSGMTLNGKRTEALELPANAIPSHIDDISANRALNHDEIRRRAYEIYLERGCLPGQELEHWLQAEREMESAAQFMRATRGEKHRP